MTSRELDEARRWYAEEIRVVANLQSPALVKALAAVPRERFLGPGPWRLIGDKPPLRLSRRRSQNPSTTTSSSPLTVSVGSTTVCRPILCQLIDSLEIEPGDRILHIGCGTGYYSAIMAEVSRLLGPGNRPRDRQDAGGTRGPQPRRLAHGRGGPGGRGDLRAGTGRRDPGQRRRDPSDADLARRPWPSADA